ncbi:MAG: LamG-like jellyroll fold domain-containing protein [Candidatus Micrarchaeia archaeon]
MFKNLLKNKKDNKQKESQSAMEYLMTYGWAILIIAVVLVVLFHMGIFNTNTGPKALPGSCKVYRPNGPGTTYLMSLEGVCSRELPEYVAQFNGEGFIGSTIPIIPEGTNSITFTMWFNSENTAFTNPPYSDPNLLSYGAVSSCNPGQPTDIYIYNHQVSINWWCGGLLIPMTLQNNNWYFVAYSWNGVVAEGFVGSSNSLVNNTASEINSISASGISIGTYGSVQTGNAPFVGYISNIQIYNTSLSANEIQALYQEGIGGVPIDLQNLIAWYPLNGNANDYSGNGNNGVPKNVIFTSLWENGYNQP